MIACISHADINAEETLNTLKYANRARNIRNKPVVNRNPLATEMLKMRQQLEYLQAELCAQGGGGSPNEIQVNHFYRTKVEPTPFLVLKEKIAFAGLKLLTRNFVVKFMNTVADVVLSHMGLKQT